jgi:hypothetical protein
MAEASIGAAKEFEGIPGKPYRVDTGPNAAKDRVRVNMAPLNHEKQTPTSPQGIPHRLSVPRVDSYNMYNCDMPRDSPSRLR